MPVAHHPLLVLPAQVQVAVIALEAVDQQSHN